MKKIAFSILAALLIVGSTSYASQQDKDDCCKKEKSCCKAKKECCDKK